MNNQYTTAIIGIDIGGVIIAQDTDNPDLFFSKEFLKAKPHVDSFASIQKIVSKFGRQNVFIISKCGLNIQTKSREWLEKTEFYNFTGFNKDNVNFCIERHEKAGIAESLGIDVFIDDRYTVLKHMISSDTMQKLILFKPNETEQKLSEDNPNSKIIQVESWNEIVEILGL